MSQGAGFNHNGGVTDSIGRAEGSMEPVTYLADKSDGSDWTFMELADMVKKNQRDMLSLLKGKISITEIAV